jgi:hypothetical protein
MRKRSIIGFVAAGVLAFGAGPALADGLSGSSEHHEDCTTDPATGEETCTTVYDNEVTCGTEGEGGNVPAPTGDLDISGNGDPTAPAGELEVCSDGEGAVLQGRIIAGGSADGGYVIVDGDNSNTPEQAKGFARVDIGAGPPTVTCGADGGHKDGTEPEPTDSQAACG